MHEEAETLIRVYSVFLDSGGKAEQMEINGGACRGQPMVREDGRAGG